jgi:hypothetical protein
VVEGDNETMRAAVPPARLPGDLQAAAVTKAGALRSRARRENEFVKAVLSLEEPVFVEAFYECGTRNA